MFLAILPLPYPERNPSKRTFVMVELSGVPYVDIIAAAFLPAVLYFLVVWVGINAYAQHHELKGIEGRDQPQLAAVAVMACFFLIPFALLLWAICFLRIDWLQELVSKTGMHCDWSAHYVYLELACSLAHCSAT